MGLTEPGHYSIEYSVSLLAAVGQGQGRHPRLHSTPAAPPDLLRPCSLR